MASSCVLRATGKYFQPNKFLGSSSLKPCNIFQKGEPRTISELWETSGITIEVSSGNEFSVQVRDAITFIEENKPELLRLKQFSGIENLNLNFGINWKNGFMQSHLFILKLIKLANDFNLELEISIYTS